MLKNKKILVLSSITTFPINSGAHVRSYEVINALASYNELKVFVPIIRKSDFPKFFSFFVDCGSYLEHRNVNYIIQFVTFLFERLNIFGLSYLYLYKLLLLNSNLKFMLEWSDCVILNFPHLMPLLDDYNKPIYYLSHNVEFDLIKQNVKNKLIGNFVGKKIFEIEKLTCQVSEKIFVCTQNDKELYASNFSINKDKIIVLPNGINDKIIDEALIKPILLDNGKINFLFVGSNYAPNRQAVEYIETLAARNSGYNFIIIGSVCNNKSNMSNVQYLGFVDQNVLNSYLKYCDYAINPIFSGGGSSLKVLDYMKYGLPIITTRLGIRGFEEYVDVYMGNDYDIADIIKYINENRSVIVNKGYEIVKANSWGDLVYKTIIDNE